MSWTDEPEAMINLIIFEEEGEDVFNGVMNIMTETIIASMI